VFVPDGRRRKVYPLVEFGDRDFGVDLRRSEDAVGFEDVAYPVVADPLEHHSIDDVLCEEDVAADRRRGGVLPVPDDREPPPNFARSSQDQEA
jgi:hypothetical protein